MASTNLPRVRFGEWIKHEEGWTRLDKILNIDILPQGDDNHPDTKNQDAFYVEIIIDMPDIWLPSLKAWAEGPKHAKAIEFIDYPRREVYRGTREECEAVVKQIMER